MIELSSISNEPNADIFDTESIMCSSVGLKYEKSISCNLDNTLITSSVLIASNPKA